MLNCKNKKLRLLKKSKKTFKCNNSKIIIKINNYNKELL